MTPPLNFDDLADIIGPDRLGRYHDDEQMKIDMMWKDGPNLYYSGGCLPWYPASSLRLVEELKVGDYAEVVLPGTSFTGKIGQVSDDRGIETVALFDMGVWNRRNLRKLSDEEIKEHLALKIGDWVEVIGPSAGNSITKTGMIDKIISSNPWGPRDQSYSLQNSCFVYLSKSLRKLTPEEITNYLSKNDPPVNTPQNQFNEKVDRRLSAIESRLDKLAQSHVDLLRDVEALAEEVGAIEKRQEKINNRCSEVVDANDDILSAWKAEREDIKKRLAILEGEAPELCDDCKPPEGQISISIQRGKNEVHGISYSECPEECLVWCKRVLDGMRKER